MKNQVPLLLITSCALCSALYNHYRLPGSVKPLTYNLRVLTHLEENKTEHSKFKGEVSIKLLALVKASNVTLHVKDLHIDKSRTQLLQQSTNESIEIVGTELVNEYNYYILKLAKQLQPDEHYELKLAFGAEFHNYDFGYFRKQLSKHKYMAATRLEPCYARTAFPCFDEPDLKAKFTIALGHDKRFQAMSNMPLARQRPHETLWNYIWSEFEETVQMSTYLVAYSINEYERSVTSLTPSNVQITTWPYNVSDLADTAYINDCTAQALDFLENFVKIKFPLPKIDQLSIPETVTAMENWGLITYPSYILCNISSSLLTAENADSRIETNIYAFTYLAHEVCHQWFGNLVTLKWWSDLWLNEAFATHMSVLVMQNIQPQLEASRVVILYNLISILYVDLDYTSLPVVRYVYEPDTIIKSFNYITYRKGAVLLHMLQHFIGDVAFFDGLRAYLAQHAYGNVARDDLWQALGASTARQGTLDSKYSIATIMDSWLLQPGYPLINVRRDYKTGSVLITQRRLFRLVKFEVNVSCWWVPLTYTTARNPNFNNTVPEHWYECGAAQKKTQVLQLNVNDGHWLIFNLQMSGLFSINYDLTNWRLLIHTLDSDDFQHIHVMNRAQLVHDVLMLACYDNLNEGIALNLISYLRRELELEPWIMALKGCEALERIVYNDRNKHAYFKKFMMKIIRPVLQYLKHFETEHKVMTVTQRILKLKMEKAACHYDHFNCG